MNELKVFHFEGEKVRTQIIDGDPWWVLKDVCDVLELTNSRKVASRLDEDEKDGVTLSDTIGRKQKTTIINESGLYNVILRSDKPKAQKFKRWVTHEVLPSIRKTGKYEMEPEPEIITLSKAVLISQKMIEEKDKKIAELTPKANFADALTLSEDVITIGTLSKLMRSKGINIGKNRLYQELRDDGFLIKRTIGEWNLPSQTAMELGLFQIQENVSVGADGKSTINKITMVTGEGQQYFINRYMKRGKEK